MGGVGGSERRACLARAKKKELERITYYIYYISSSPDAYYCKDSELLTSGLSKTRVYTLCYCVYTICHVLLMTSGFVVM